MIAEKLEQIEHVLARRGIPLRITRQPPATSAEIAEAEQTLGYPFPDDLKEIYVRFANGFDVFWREDDTSNSDGDFGSFFLPSLTEFVRESLRFREETRGYYDNPDQYFDSSRLEEARLVLGRMLHWGVLWDTGGDGNLVCIDLQNGEVLFHEREWSFYDSYINGYLIAPSLNRMIEGWGNVCFVYFSGIPGECPAHGASAIPDYSSPKFNLSLNTNS